MMIFEFEETPVQNALMKVVGVGGAGGNAVNRMVDEELEGVEFISMNTDAQALKGSLAQVTMQIGKKLTRGLGAGARPEIGRQAVHESRNEGRKSLEGADLELGDSWGLAAHAGIDIAIGERGALRIDARWIDIDTTVKVNNVNLGTAKLDPLVYGAAWVMKF